MLASSRCRYRAYRRRAQAMLATGAPLGPPRLRTIQVYPKDVGSPLRHARSWRAAILHPPKARRRAIMMHPHLPGPRPLAVPGIGFPQNISVGPEARDAAAFGHLPPLTQPAERIVWVPSPWPWFAFRS